MILIFVSGKDWCNNSIFSSNSPIKYFEFDIVIVSEKDWICGIDIGFRNRGGGAEFPLFDLLSFASKIFPQIFG